MPASVCVRYSVVLALSTAWWMSYRGRGGRGGGGWGRGRGGGRGGRGGGFSRMDQGPPDMVVGEHSNAHRY